MTLQDEDKMPYGTHKGKRMMDIPAEYFHAVWVNNRRDVKGDAVMEYIKRNLSALKKDHPDGIWD